MSLGESMQKSCLLLIVIVLCVCCCTQEAIVAPNQNLILGVGEICPGRFTPYIPANPVRPSFHSNFSCSLFSHACEREFKSILTWSAHARKLPDHTAASGAAGASGSRRAVEIAAGVESWTPVRPHAVTTAEIVEIDQVALLAAIGQLEYPAVVLGAANITDPEEIAGCILG